MRPREEFGRILKVIAGILLFVNFCMLSLLGPAAQGEGFRLVSIEGFTRSFLITMLSAIVLFAAGEKLMTGSFLHPHGAYSPYVRAAILILKLGASIGWLWSLGAMFYIFSFLHGNSEASALIWPAISFSWTAACFWGYRSLRERFRPTSPRA